MQTGKLGIYVSKIAPWAIIAGLLIVAQIEPAPVGEPVQIPAIGERDRYYGVQVPEPGIIWMVGNGSMILKVLSRLVIIKRMQQQKGCVK